MYFSSDEASSSADVSNFVLVEYPGVVKNVDRALATLGGIGAVAQATLTSGQLELRYQPENVYLSGVVAEKRLIEEADSGHIQLVVRVRRRKRKAQKTNLDGAPERSEAEKSLRPGGSSSASSIVDIKCLGMVSMVFSFSSMCDFHYLPLRRVPRKKTAETTAASSQNGGGGDGDNNTAFFEDLVPLLIPTTLFSAMSWFESTGLADTLSAEHGLTPHFLPPSSYSRYMTPTTKIMCNATSAGDADKSLGGHAKNLRTERKAFTVTVMGQDAFPEAPSEAALRDVSTRVKNAQPHERVEQMFAERPLWTRAALLQKTDLDDSVLKVILAKYAFYITSGPWGRCWCKFGYDPRKDSSAKQYQTVMVSFRDHKNIPERQRLKLSLGGVTATPNSVGNREFNQLIDYVYRPGVLPPVRQMWYCVCDILLSPAQKVLRKDFFAVLKQCHESHGWLPPEIIVNIRNAIKEDVQRVTHLIETSDDYTMPDAGGGPPAAKSASSVVSGAGGASLDLLLARTGIAGGAASANAAGATNGDSIGLDDESAMMMMYGEDDDGLDEDAVSMDGW